MVYEEQLQREKKMQKKVIKKKKTQPVQQEVVQTVSASQSQQPKEQLGTCAFRVIGTYNQIKNLRKFMVDNGIKFETIKTEGN